MTTKIDLQSDSILIAGKAIQLPSPVKKVIEEQGKYFVLIPRNHPEKRDQNLLCFDQTGDLIWEIELLPFNDPDQLRPYSNIYVNEAGELIAVNYVGIESKVNRETGRITLITGGRPW